MLRQEITDLLSIDFQGLFKDTDHCFAILAAKRDSGDTDTPEELTNEPIFDLSPDLMVWVAKRHIENGTARLVASDIMSNISSQSEGLSESYETMVVMLADAGHLQRAAQIRRSVVAGDVAAYRDFLNAEKAVSRYDDMPEEKRLKLSSNSVPSRAQRAMAAQAPKFKASALKSIGVFENWVQKNDIAPQHSAQIDLWREELSGQKAKLPAPDKTAMSETLFWEILEQAKGRDEAAAIMQIEDRLIAYTAKTIRDASKILQAKLADAYREDVWALAYLLKGGCSDDAFDEFRNWIVLQGCDIFDATLKDPDSFDPHLLEGADLSAVGYVMAAFENAYMRRSGKPMAVAKPKLPNIEVREELFAKLLPNIAAKT